MSAWKKIVGAVAPTLGTLLGGPMAGGVVRELAEKLLGKPEASEAEIEQAVIAASPELLARLREIEASYKTRMAELQIDVGKLAVEIERVDASDRANARARQLSLRDWLPNALAVLIIAGFFATQALLVYAPIPEHVLNLLTRTLGTVDMMTGAVVFYYFGSSRGSKDKTDLLGKAPAAP